MLLTRERPRTPAFLPPALLPSLSDALARRAAVFGPVEVDEAPVAPRKSWHAVGIKRQQAGGLLDVVSALWRCPALINNGRQRGSSRMLGTSVAGHLRATPAPRSLVHAGTTECGGMGGNALGRGGLSRRRRDDDCDRDS